MIRTLPLLVLLGCPMPKEDDTADTDTVDTDDTDDTDTREGNLCGTVSRPTEAPAGGDVFVASVLDGATACVGGDSGGPGWWDETVDEPALIDETFVSTLEPGTYGVEVVAPGNWGGCAGVEITGTEQCAHELLVELGYQVPVDKPNVYLYPTAPSSVSVKVPPWRKITESDPQYPVEGWRVRAFPDGRLATKAGPRDFLFYELLWDPAKFQTEEGWCVPGKLAQATIEDAMGDLGFLQNEIDDFASGWDENFPVAEWMTIYPQWELSPLVIEPAPEHLLRTWFYVADGCDAVVAPELPETPRVGWHAAEWGISFRQPLDRGELLIEGWR